MLKENLRNWFNFRSTRAKFGKCLIRNFLYLRELDTTKRQINKTCFWWIVYIYYDMVLKELFTRRLAQHWRLVTPNFTWLWLSCWMYYFEAIKRLQNSLFFRRVKLDHWSLFGLVTWVQTIGLRVWNSRWRPLLICLLITLSLKGLTQIHHACFLCMYFLLLSSICICRVEMIHWKYFQSVAFLSWRSWW